MRLKREGEWSGENGRREKLLTDRREGGRDRGRQTKAGMHSHFSVLLLLFVCFLNFPLALVQIGPINRTRLSSRSLTRSANALGVGERRLRGGRSIDLPFIIHLFDSQKQLPK